MRNYLYAWFYPLKASAIDLCQRQISGDHGPLVRPLCIFVVNKQTTLNLPDFASVMYMFKEPGLKKDL